MDILQDLLNSVKEVNDGLTKGDLIKGVMLRHEDDIMDRQKEQLFEGKNGKDEDMRPYYSEDLKPSGYFKSKESAQRYADWKLTISYPIDADRNTDAPNLYINGKFHSELGVDFGSDVLTIKGATPYAAGIVAKYGLQMFGISESRWLDIWENCAALQELMIDIENTLWQK